MIMKTKNLVIIFILFLLIALAGGLAVFLTREKNRPVVNEQFSAIAKPAQPASEELTENVEDEPEIKATSTAKQVAQEQIEEKIKAVMLISGVKYEAEIKPGSSVYDLMDLLKMEKKINFSGKNYLGLGFFVEEINGLKNNPSGANWLYYVNGRLAPVGISGYVINNNDIIEWKYEKKSF